jgi:hypothetical protein
MNAACPLGNPESFNDVFLSTLMMAPQKQFGFGLRVILYNVESISS